jgi:hypothetical protein
MHTYGIGRQEERRDLDQAEKYFRLAVDAAPHDSDALCDLANFLCKEVSAFKYMQHTYMKIYLSLESIAVLQQGLNCTRCSCIMQAQKLV